MLNKCLYRFDAFNNWFSDRRRAVVSTSGRGMLGILRRGSAGRAHAYAQLCREVREARGVRMIRRHLQILKQMLTYLGHIIT